MIKWNRLELTWHLFQEGSKFHLQFPLPKPSPGFTYSWSLSWLPAKGFTGEAAFYLSPAPDPGWVVQLSYHMVLDFRMGSNPADQSLNSSPCSPSQGRGWPLTRGVGDAVNTTEKMGLRFRWPCAILKDPSDPTTWVWRTVSRFVCLFVCFPQNWGCSGLYVNRKLVLRANSKLREIAELWWSLRFGPACHSYCRA